MTGLRFAIATRPADDLVARFRRATIAPFDQQPCRCKLYDCCDAGIAVVGPGGALHLPWLVDGFGEVMLSTTSLMRREAPYRLVVELARGQLTLVRNTIADYELRGWCAPESLHERLREAIATLRRAILTVDDTESDRLAGRSLHESLAAGEEAVVAFARARLDEQCAAAPDDPLPLGGNLTPSLIGSHYEAAFTDVFHQVEIPVDWRRIETNPGVHNWRDLDRSVEWCLHLRLPFSVGPLIDFHPRRLPDWLLEYRNDVVFVFSRMVDFVQNCLFRYRGKVLNWQITGHANIWDPFRMGGRQMLSLCGQILAVANKTDPTARYGLALDQPWTDEPVGPEREFSSLAFLDTLVRMSVPISIVTLEFAMGYHPGGSYWRSLLDFSSLLEAYHRLGVALRVRLFAPSGPVPPMPDGASTEHAGEWHGPPSEALQADWAERAAIVALSKTFVESVAWGTFRDDADDAWRRAGLIDGEGRPKSAWDRLRQLHGIAK